MRVFEMNNAIIKGFPVRTLDTLTAIKRTLPPEVILTACATVFALLMMWLTPKVLEVSKAWEGGADAFSTDAVETTQSRSQEL